MRKLLLLLILLPGCHAYVPILSEIEVAPIRALEYGDFERARDVKYPKPLVDPERATTQPSTQPAALPTLPIPAKSSPLRNV